MDQFNSGTQTVIQNVAELLRTGKFSDLTLTCQQQQFHVHRAIVCARSPVWAAAAEGSFKEANTKIVEVDVVDACTLQRALTYLYTDGYDDSSSTVIDDPSRTTEIQYMSNDQAYDTEPAELRESTPPSRHVEADVEGFEAVISPPHCEAPPQRPEERGNPQHEEMNVATEVANDDYHDCFLLQRIGFKPICNNAKLRVNTLVYIFADYYQVPELKRIAVEKFAAALDGICQKGLGDVCHLVYESAPPTALDLRSCLAGAIANYGKQLVKDTSFMSAVLHLPELLRDCLTDLVRQKQIICGKMDAAVAASLKAEDEAKDANARGQEEKQRIIAQVNHARRCRHCSLENNVLFELEGSQLGRCEYSFRCRCRTRY